MFLSAHFVRRTKMNFSTSGIYRWAVNTNSWNPTRTEWVSAMRLVGNDEERCRINRFVFKKDAKHAIVGRLLIRKCCLEYLGSDLFHLSSENKPCNNQISIVRSEKGKPILVQKSEDKIRLQIELEFVQCLANPNYLNYLAQRGYFKDKPFINYLEYLQYWKRPEYAKFIKYPMCLHFLDLLQHEHFRRELTSSQCAKFIDDQIILHWHHYARKRTKLFQSVQQPKPPQGSMTPGQALGNLPSTAPNASTIVNGHANLK